MRVAKDMTTVLGHAYNVSNQPCKVVVFINSLCTSQRIKIKLKKIFIQKYIHTNDKDVIKKKNNNNKNNLNK